MEMSSRIAVVSLALVLASSGAALADKHYGPGVTDTEIKLGQTQPFSGPVSAASAEGRSSAAYFDMINAEGGINGRKIKLIALDDGFVPPRTVEQTRRLVEEDNVLAMVGSLGSPTQAVVQKYLNAKKVPQLLIISGAKRFNDPKNFPYTVSFYSNFTVESGAYAQYILHEKPNAKIAVLYQNDEFGKDYYDGFKAGLGTAGAKMIVADAAFETTDPTVDSQIIALQASGADVLVDFSTQKFAAQAIRKAYDLGWKPLHIVDTVASSVASVLRPAGLERSIGLVSGTMIKDTSYADKDVATYLAFMKKWNPNGDPDDAASVWGYLNGQLATLILKNCGDELTRENIIKQTTSLRDVHLSMQVDGVSVTFTPEDYAGLHAVQMARFDGKHWVKFGGIVGVDTLKAQ
jgi:ABC-type branched-subunit amino acid transport system substrate-binding protein